MAMIYNAQKAPFGAITTFRITSALNTVIDNALMWNARRAQTAEFTSLSPRELEDIGLLAVPAKSQGVFTGIFTRITVWVQDKIAARQAAAQLNALSPKMLEDIGMTRADVEAIRAQASFL